MLGMLENKFAGASRVLSDAAAAGARILERLGRDGGTGCTRGDGRRREGWVTSDRDSWWEA